MELDEVLQTLGAYGRWQILVYMAISVFDNLPSIWHMSVMTFLGYTPEHHCKLPEGTSVNRSIPQYTENGVVQYEKCEKYEEVNGTLHNRTVGCGGEWWYSRDDVVMTTTTEWNLVCDRKVLPETSQMVFNFGVMFGALLFGFLSDKFGRKIVFIGSLLTQGVLGGITAASPNFIVFMVIRFFVGAMEQGVNITGFIMATELFPPKQRSIAAVSHEFLWAIGGAILPVFAYFLREWRHLQLAVSLPSLLGVFLWWTIPESLVWLVAKGKTKEAEEILQRAARFNNKELPLNCLSANSAHKATKSDVVADGNDCYHANEHRTYTIVDLFRSRNLFRITVCLSLLWVLNTTVYYGLSYNTPNLDGDMYLNFFIGQMVEIPSVAVTLFLIYRVGRRIPLCLFHVFGGVVCIASPFIPAKTSSGVDLTWLSVTLAMLGKFSINASFTIIYIYGPEIYPTVLRNTGAGFGSMAGRFGGIIYPYINYLSKLDSKLSKQLPLMVFGILSIVGGFFALPLPETRHRPLPDTIQDIENYDEFCRRHQSQKKELEQELECLDGNGETVGGKSGEQEKDAGLLA